MAVYNSKALCTPWLLLACALLAAGGMAAASEPGVIVMQNSAGLGSPLDSVLVSEAAMAIVDLPGITAIAASECITSSNSSATVDCIVVYVSNAAVAAQLPATLGNYPIVIRTGGPAETNLP